MKITEWLGFNEDSSQYLLRPGELKSLRNLQPRRAGMLLSRPGTKKLYGKYDGESIFGLYRRDNGFGEPDDYLWFQRGIVDRQLTQEQIEALEVPEQYIWFVRRVLGNQERVIDQILVEESTADLTGVSIAEDRHGRMFLFYGHGIKPKLYRPSSLANVAIEMGLDAPRSAPSIVHSGQGYYLESVNVLSSGSSYWGPPGITVEGGDPEKPARLRGIVSRGILTGIEVLDGGTNYRKAPTIKADNTTVGIGFRGLGNTEADPGVQGFSDTDPASVTGTAPGDNETYGEKNGVDNNRIMYFSEESSASTRTESLPVASTTQFAVESVSGIAVGDMVTVAQLPTGGDPDSDPPSTLDPLARVTSIDKATRVITISKPFTPGKNGTFKISFRKTASVGYADAIWNSTTKRFSATLPLSTTSGTGRGAQATLTFTPKAYSFGLGSFDTSDTAYTVPQPGLESAKFAYHRVGWNTFLYDEYWAGTRFDIAGSGENRTYAGLQASGKTFAFGYGGNQAAQSSKNKQSRKADIYWPDYSELSVWLNTGVRTNNIGQWSRKNVTVVRDGGANDSSPYIDVELRPVSGSRISSPTGKTAYSTSTSSSATSEEFRYPKVRIHLKACPDSWTTDGAGDGFNLPFNVKESQVERLAWWNKSAITPRPIIDVQGQSEAVDWATAEVIDPGAGWEKNTRFALRIYQANPYATKTDYNTGVQEDKIAGSHSFFSATSGYIDFEFRATSPDDFTPDGPPHQLDGDQFIDNPGLEFRAGDKAAVTLLKRDSGTADGAVSTEFTALFTVHDPALEGTTAGSPPVQVPAGVLYRVTGNTTGISPGDFIRCDTEGVLLDATEVLTADTEQANGPQYVRLDLAPNPEIIADLAPTAGYITQDESGQTWINFASSTNQFFTTGTRLWADLLGDVGEILEVKVNSAGDKLVRISTSQAVGSENFRPIFSFQATTGITEAETLEWTAEQLVDAPTPAENKVTSIRIISKGRNYQSAPSIRVRGGGNGYGLTVSANVDDGKITSVDIVDPGRNYTEKPELYTDSTPAKVSPNMRPTMRGVYRCAYRYADRSEQVVFDGIIAAVDSEAPTVIKLESTDGLKFDQVVECDLLPQNTRILSVEGDEVHLNQPVEATGPVSEIVMLGEGRGYAEGEVPSCSVVGHPEIILQAVMGEYTETDTFYVAGVNVVDPGDILFPLERIEIKIAAPAAGGVAATGYGKVTTLDKRPLLESLKTDQQVAAAAAQAELDDIDSQLEANAEAITAKEIQWDLERQNTGNYAELAQIQYELSVLLLEKAAIESSRAAAQGTLDSANAKVADTQSRIDSFTPADGSVKIRDLTKPAAYSDFSPIADVDTGDNASKLEWSLPGAIAPERADSVELWRTSSDQSLVFYRVEAYGKPSGGEIEIVGDDTLSDEQLFDPERGNYAAMPIVLPNGDLNAYRFGKPRDDMSVAVAFQDRLWMGVSTSSENANTVYYSEFDEFESCPDINDLPIQINQKSSDRIVALVPFGSSLLLMQNSHAYALQYNTAPNVDASVQMMSHRGVLHQRCWDIHENILYAADEAGIYAMARNGEVQPLSAAIKEFFVSESIDFSKRDTFFLAVDPRTHILRFFCTLKSSSTDTPDFALCYDIEKKAWWTEHHSNSFCSAVSGRPGDAKISTLIYGAVDGNIYETTGHSDHSNKGLTTVEVRDGGDGYKVAPKVRVPNCPGAQARAVVSEGRVVDALVYAPGWDGMWGMQLLTEDGKYLSDPFDNYVQGIEYAPIELEMDPPPAGGREADVRVNYGVWTRRRPRVTVAEGESFVRLYGPIAEPVTRPDPPLFTAQDGSSLILENGNNLQVEFYPVEVGDEAIGEYLPLRCYVSKIDGQDIYLSHPDGTPVSALGGEPRRSDDGDAYMEAGGTEAEIYFYKPFKTSVPFRLSTGFQQLANEDNVKGGDGLVDRSVTLLYSPTETKKEVEVIRFFDGSASAKANVAGRQRGGPGGFSQPADSASSILNMEANASDMAPATGVARAMYASRHYTDSTGEPQYIQVELLGRPHPDNGWGDMIGQQYVMHSLTIDGVVGNGE